MYIPDLTLTVEDFEKSATRQFFWYDNTGGFNKAYAQRYSNSPLRSFLINDVIQSEVNYRFHWFVAGAGDALSGF
jgi:hypothetical protein